MKLIHVCCVLALSAASVHAAGDGEFELALAARERADPSGMILFLRSAAGQGHIRAQEMLGSTLLRSVEQSGSKDNLSEAATWIMRAWAEGSPEAIGSMQRVADGHCAEPVLAKHPLCSLGE